MARLMIHGKTIKVEKSVSIKGDIVYVDGKAYNKDLKLLEEDKPIICSGIVTPDGTILISTYRHDYVAYIDKNGKEYMVDGGFNYERRSANGDERSFVVRTDSPIQIIRFVTGRSGYGKNGKGEFRCTLLKDMSNKWLKASIDYVENTGDQILLELYKRELAYRKSKNINIKDGYDKVYSSWRDAISSIDNEEFLRLLLLKSLL